MRVHGTDSMGIQLQAPAQDNGAAVKRYFLRWESELNHKSVFVVTTEFDFCSSCVNGSCVPTFKYRCSCHNGFAGDNCDKCAQGYFGYPNCMFDFLLFAST